MTLMTMLPRAEFEAALAALPLVSVDWVLTNPSGAMLVGERLNAPARGSWFTPGGRVRKGEPLAAALERVAAEELGLPRPLASALAARGRLMGAWDHMYTDSAFSPDVPTHYVNLPHWAALTEAELSRLALPLGEQHGAWRWLAPSEAAGGAVHAYVKPYAEWLLARQKEAA